MNPLALSAFAVVGLVGLSLGLFTTRRLWAVTDTPTIPAGHAFPGRIEVFGETRLPAGVSLTSPLTGSACAWWKADIQQQETSGDTKKWKTKETVASTLQILLHDKSGHVRVDLGDRAPQNARSETLDRSALPNITPAMLKRVADGAPLHTLTPPHQNHRDLLSTVIGAVRGDTYGPELNLATASGEWRVVEQRVEIGDPLYVLGSARALDSGPVVLSRKYGSLVAYRGEQHGLLTRLRLSVYTGFALFVSGAAAFLGYIEGDHTAATGVRDEFSIPHAVLGAWIALLCIAAVQAVRIRNRIVAAREQVYSSWALIDIASSKRAALVPALQEAVTAAASHERSTLEHLTLARTRSIEAVGPKPDTQKLEAALQAHTEGLSAIDDMRALQERQPAILTNPNYMKLFEELVDLENNVTAARAYYVDAQTVLRNRLGSFPDSWLAEFAGKMPPELIDHRSATSGR